MEGNEIVKKAQEAFEKSKRDLEQLKAEIARQDAEFSAIKKERQPW